MARAQTYHGHPCRKCGGTERYMKRNCVACTKREATERQNADPVAYRARHTAWVNKNREYVRSQQRLRKYGLAPESFAELLFTQDGKCAGCCVDITTRSHVDHDHSTGYVRGLLCQHCNIALGLIDDSPTVLRRLAEYLEAQNS